MKRSSRSLYQLATRYYNGDGVRKNWRRAFLLTKQAAEQGYRVAMDALGSCYLYGIGTKRSPRIAVVWYRRGAENGNLDAQYNLAAWYFLGGGGWRESQGAGGGGPGRG